MKTNSNKPSQKFQVRGEQKNKFTKKRLEEKSKGLGVSVHGDDINKALRIFKKKILTDGRLNDFHERQFHTKKSEKRRLSKAAGRQRWLRKLAETPGPHQPRKKTNNKKGI